MAFERDYRKYYVLKRYDIIDALTPKQKQDFLEILTTIDSFRDGKGKKSNTYVVVNEDEPYTDIVWKLVEFNCTHTSDEVQRLLTNLSIELY